MKRPSSASQEQIQKLFETLVNEYCAEPQNLPPSLTQHVDAIFDRAICLEKRMDPTISFFCPPEIVFPRLAKIKPEKLQEKSDFSNQAGKHIKFLLVFWKLTSKEIIDELFGPTILATRNYSDSQGRHNYAEKQGGELRPLISSLCPFRLTYNTRTWELNVSFRFDKMKGFIEDGRIVFKSVV